MSELRALMREDDDTASTGSEDPDAEDRATVTTVTADTAAEYAKGQKIFTHKNIPVTY